MIDSREGLNPQSTGSQAIYRYYAPSDLIKVRLHHQIVVAANAQWTIIPVPSVGHGPIVSTS
jgi:hypothetical protein